MVAFFAALAASFLIAYAGVSLAERTGLAERLRPMFAGLAGRARRFGETPPSVFRLPVILTAGLIFLAISMGPPLAVVVLALALLYLLARAWVRELRFLMTLNDDAFPGHHDKLIWAMLLIVLPPVGTWLFGSYRQAHWPEPDAAKTRMGGESA